MNISVILIIGCASFVRGAVGFGDALIAMPLLAFVVPTTFSAPLVALAAFLMAVVLLIREWKHLEFRSAAIFIGSALIGIPIGNAVFGIGNDRSIKFVLGIVVLLFAVWSLKRPGNLILKSDRSAPLFGIISGILGGAYNIAGPPVVIFSTMRGWSPAKFRSIMQAYCIVGSVGVVSMHAYSGRLTASVLWQFAATIPVLVAATIAGQRLTRNMNKQRFTWWVNACLLLSSIALLISCFTTA